MADRLVIDPLTRIEGHLRIETKLDATNKITEAYSAGTMFRGLEIILKGRDPREAWMYTQRVCGVCTTVHAICSVRAVENALKVTIPENARLIRNILEIAQFIHDHTIHFYHLHALDWVDVTSALKASASATSTLQKSISDWSNNSTAYFQAVQDKLRTLVNSGQLGPFANGYWGHPAYKLSPEANLMLTAHYLEALNFQRDYIKIHATIGGKNPHPQTYAVGGMTVPLDKSSSKALNPTKIATLKTIAQQGVDFVNKVYYPDVLLVAKTYKEWAKVGAGVPNMLSFGDFPQDQAGNLYLPRGIVLNRNLAVAPRALDQTQIKEYIARSWYSYSSGDSTGLHPSQGQTTPNYTGPTPPYANIVATGKYSWLKTPRYNNQPMEVGPLARMAVAYAAGVPSVRTEINNLLSTLGLGAADLFSTLGRTAARAVETKILAPLLGQWLSNLSDRINGGDLVTCNNSKWNPSTWPSNVSGWGTTEAPRGGLGHWVNIVNGKINSYQCVVPTTWNGSPRDAAGIRGPFEESLIGQTVVDPNRPLEILRTIHSFDPCMACAVHVVDAKDRPVTEISNSFMRR